MESNWFILVVWVDKIDLSLLTLAIVVSENWDWDLILVFDQSYEIKEPTENTLMEAWNLFPIGADFPVPTGKKIYTVDVFLISYFVDFYESLGLVWMV